MRRRRRLHRRAFRPERREIVADAAALLQRQRRFAQMREDAAHVESGIVPITKQLNNVTLRSVPAPARMRPAGRNL